jgi:hypothetical protein
VGDGSPRSATARAIARGAHWFRDAWLIAGLSLLLFVGLEVGVRVYERLFPPRASQTKRATADPYAGSSWFPAWRVARDRHVCCWNIDFDPYRGWWVRPGRHEGLEVDASGHRHTTRSIPAGDAPRRVFLLGGSTMWGYTVRDAATIPSLVDTELARAGVRDVVIENFAQSGYNLTQEIATLVLELRRGARPTAAVFLDGVNEIGVVVEGGKPGEIYAEASARERFERGAANSQDLMLYLASRLHVVKALQSLRPKPPLAPVDVAGQCRAIAEHYANLMRVGEALGREFGFDVLYFWQPTLATSGKAPGPWEAHLLAERDSLGARMTEMTRACVPEMDARVSARSGVSYFPLHALYDGVPDDQFLDHYGHVTEEANAAIASAIAERLLPVLAGPTGGAPSAAPLAP